MKMRRIRVYTWRRDGHLSLSCQGSKWLCEQNQGREWNQGSNCQCPRGRATWCYGVERRTVGWEIGKQWKGDSPSCDLISKKEVAMASQRERVFQIKKSVRSKRLRQKQDQPLQKTENSTTTVERRNEKVWWSQSNGQGLDMHSFKVLYGSCHSTCSFAGSFQDVVRSGLKHTFREVSSHPLWWLLNSLTIKKWSTNSLAEHLRSSVIWLQQFPNHTLKSYSVPLLYPK